MVKQLKGVLKALTNGIIEGQRRRAAWTTAQTLVAQNRDFRGLDVHDLYFRILDEDSPSLIRE